MKTGFFVSAFMALLFSAFTANAATVTSGGTGTSGSGGFTLTGGSGTIVDLIANRAWWNAPTTPASNWVWDSTNTSGSTLTFSYSFDLTGFNAATAVLSGLWAVDNEGTASLNGNLLSTLGFVSSSYSTPHAFGTSSFFNPGVNTLTFTAIDHGLPGGFRAAFTVVAPDVAPVPVPAAFPLLLAALGGLGFVARRRKAA